LQVIIIGRIAAMSITLGPQICVDNSSQTTRPHWTDFHIISEKESHLPIRFKSFFLTLLQNLNPLKISSSISYLNPFIEWCHFSSHRPRVNLVSLLPHYLL
jgi:hypothetical protein